MDIGVWTQACDKGVQWERALELLDRMEERDRAKPNLFAYNYAISACIRCLETLRVFRHLRTIVKKLFLVAE